MTQASPEEPLPEHWPDRPPTPVRPRRISWPIAVAAAPLFWLLPKRMGPHFAESGWATAFVAQVLWGVYGIGCVMVAINAPRYGWIAYLAGQSPGQTFAPSWPASTLSDVARSPMALISHGLASAIRGTEDLILTVGAVASVELLVVLFAALLIPYVAAGERLSRLHGRCIRLTLWSSTSLIVLGLALQALYIVAPDKSDSYIGAIISLYIGWFLWMCIRSGLRYAGPQDGPAWEPHPPRCENCGYRLTGLTRRDRCPECGEPIVMSLPERRSKTLFAAEHRIQNRTPGYFATAAIALLDREFYSCLAIRHGHGDARRFALWTCLAGGFTIATMLFLLGWLEGVAGEVPMLGYYGDVGLMQSLATTVTWSVTFAVILVLLAGLIAFAVSGMRRAPIRPCSTVVFYQLIWIVPVAVAVLIAAACINVLQAGWSSMRPSRFSRFYNIYQLIHFLVAVTLYSPAILMIARAGVRAWWGMRQTRYANA